MIATLTSSRRGEKTPQEDWVNDDELDGTRRRLKILEQTGYPFGERFHAKLLRAGVKSGSNSMIRR